MKLKDIELIPGVIVDVNDPNKLGRIKANAPSLFKGSDNLPWIYPFTNSGGSFSMPVEGKKVWILNDTSNYMGFWYIPFFEVSDQQAELISTQDNTEVILARDEGHEAKIYYNDTEGLNLNVEESGIQISTGGEVFIRGCNDSRIIQMTGDTIDLGDDTEDFESAVLGEKLLSVLTTIKSGLEQISVECTRDCHTIHMALTFNDLAQAIDEGMNEILSQRVKLN